MPRFPIHLPRRLADDLADLALEACRAIESSVEDEDLLDRWGRLRESLQRRGILYDAREAHDIVEILEALHEEAYNMPYRAENLRVMAQELHAAIAAA